MRNNLFIFGVIVVMLVSGFAIVRSQYSLEEGSLELLMSSEASVDKVYKNLSLYTLNKVYINHKRGIIK